MPGFSTAGIFSTNPLRDRTEGKMDFGTKSYQDPQVSCVLEYDPTNDKLH